MGNIVIVGSSGHAKVVADVVREEGRHRIIGLLDRFQKAGDERLGYQILGKEEDFPRLSALRAIEGVIVAIGDNFVRAGTVKLITGISPGIRFVTAIHPRAVVARDAVVGDGTVAMAGVCVNPSCAIGRHCILNTNSSLDHDSVMRDFSSLAPNSATGGNCEIGEHSAIGMGALLVNGVRVGEHAVVGAGSTLLGDLESFKVAYGTPAKVIRHRAAGDKYL